MQKNITSRKRTIFHWHRHLGFVVSIFVILLSVTGILLNHTEKFKLDSSHIKSDFLLNWYGIKKPSIKSYMLSKNWLSLVSDKIYFNDILVEKEFANIAGAIMMDSFIIVANRNEVLLLTLDGEKIERLNETTGVPRDIVAIGVNRTNQLILKTKTSLFESNNDVTEWTQSKSKDITWSISSSLPKDLENKLIILFRGKGLTKERVILDIHSGRILGKTGPLLMDLAAILLLILSFTGTWMYVKRAWIVYKCNKLLEAVSSGDASRATVISEDNKI